MPAKAESSAAGSDRGRPGAGLPNLFDSGFDDWLECSAFRKAPVNIA